MRINYYETVSIAINDLKKRGFSSTFTIDQGQAICLETSSFFSLCYDSTKNKNS